MSKSVSVEIRITDAWEEWIVNVPDDIPDADIGGWVTEHFDETSDKYLKDSGGGLYDFALIEKIE